MTSPLLVLLPGLDGTGKLFANFTQTMDRAGIDSRIIGYPTAEPLGYEELELRVRAALPLDRDFVLLGESFSGPIAIRIAASPPPGMLGVILCGTFARNPYPALGWASAFTCLVPLKSLPRWVRALLMWGSNKPERAPAQADRAIAGVKGKVVRRRLEALLRVDAGETASRIRMPALIVYAAHDRIVPSAATRWLCSRVPHAQVAAIEGPHLLLQALPAECAAVVGRWLAAQIRQSIAPT